MTVYEAVQEVGHTETIVLFIIKFIINICPTSASSLYTHGSMDYTGKLTCTDNSKEFQPRKWSLVNLMPAMP
jgi:hypothetical protein